MAGGVIDRQKISEIVIQDFRDGKIGKISLETPELWDKWISEFVEEEEQSTTEEETHINPEYQYNEEEQKTDKPYIRNWKNK